MQPMKQKKEEEENKVVSLQLITGGKEPPDMDCWLGKLDVGACFWAQANTADPRVPGVFVLTLFRLQEKVGRVYILIMIKPDGQMEPMPVDPMRFCNQFRKYQDHVLKTEENKDEQSDRSLEGDGQRDQVEEVAGPKGVPEFL